MTRQCCVATSRKASNHHHQRLTIALSNGRGVTTDDAIKANHHYTTTVIPSPPAPNSTCATSQNDTHDTIMKTRLESAMSQSLKSFKWPLFGTARIEEGKFLGTICRPSTAATKLHVDGGGKELPRVGRKASGFGAEAKRGRSCRRFTFSLCVRVCFQLTAAAGLKSRSIRRVAAALAQQLSGSQWMKQHTL